MRSRERKKNREKNKEKLRRRVSSKVLLEAIFTLFRRLLEGFLATSSRSVKNVEELSARGIEPRTRTSLESLQLLF